VDAQPNLAIHPPPPKLRPPGAPRVPLRIFIGLGLTFPALGGWMSGHFWVDPVPPDTTPPPLSLIGWYMVLGAILGFAILAIAAVVMLAESFYADRVLRGKTVEVAQLRASGGRLIDASDAARRELERDLHDGVQPRLVALLLNVSMARRDGQFDGSPAVVDDIERELREILDDIRALASGILPPYGLAGNRPSPAITPSGGPMIMRLWAPSAAGQTRAFPATRQAGGCRSPSTRSSRSPSSARRRASEA
jgi:hypothetical protein